MALLSLSLIKMSLLFSNLLCCISKGYLLRLSKVTSWVNYRFLTKRGKKKKKKMVQGFSCSILKLLRVYSMTIISNV